MSESGSYEVGVTSGMYGISKPQELLGVAQKIANVATQGARFIQVDIENASEFIEPGVMERIRQVLEDLNIEWGVHGEMGEMMGVEGGMEIIWKQSQKRIHQYLDSFYDNFVKGDNEKYRNLLPTYLILHASSLHPMGLFVEKYKYQGHTVVDFNGEENWDDLFKKNKKLKKWFQRTLLYLVHARDSGRVFMSEREIFTSLLPNFLYEIKNIPDPRRHDVPDNTTKEKIEEMSKKHREELSKYLRAYNEKDHDEKGYEILQDFHDYLYNQWLEFSKLRRSKGAIENEEFAYVITAKYLEYSDSKDEPLWGMFFGDKSMEDLESGWEVNKKSGEEKIVKLKLYDKERGIMNLMPEVVAMVAIKYIIGHLNLQQLPEARLQTKMEYEKIGRGWDTFYDKTALEKLKIIGKIKICFENPDVMENQREGQQRLIHARHLHILAKAAKSEYIKAWIDAEHYLHNNFDPIDEIRSCEDDDAMKDFMGFHVGSPKPYAPGHDLIDVGSEAQRWIYIYCLEMKKKGFGLGEDKGLIIFERGAGRGGGNMPIHFVGQSVIAIRLIIEQLLKDTPPEDLPLSFFGVSSDGMMSVERQMAMVKEHYWDPLKGMLIVPEEDHTFLSKAAMEKGKRPEEFKKEELR